MPEDLPSWSMVVATYNRREVLLSAIRLAANQQPHPKQIIVIDASEDADASAADIARAAQAEGWDSELIFEKARVRTTPWQRNQGLTHVDPDVEVAFFFDDDTLMHPGSAEQILRVYAADKDKKIVGVMGHHVPQNPLTDPIQPAPTAEDATPAPAADEEDPPQKPLHKQWWAKQMSDENFWLPYDEPVAGGPLPASLDGFHAVRVDQLMGFCMTFRTEALRKVPFETVLIGYASFEDYDHSNRLGRHGMLVRNFDAKLHHAQATGGRPRQRAYAKFQILNRWVLHRLHATGKAADPMVHLRRWWRFAMVNTIRDLKSKRLDFPHLLGTIEARRLHDDIFSKQGPELRKWYVELQCKEMGIDPPADPASYGGA